LNRLGDGVSVGADRGCRQAGDVGGAAGLGELARQHAAAQRGPGSKAHPECFGGRQQVVFGVAAEQVVAGLQRDDGTPVVPEAETTILLRPVREPSAGAFRRTGGPVANVITMVRETAQ
jgi:hypothetical protein